MTERTDINKTEDVSKERRWNRGKVADKTKHSNKIRYRFSSPRVTTAAANHDHIPA